MSDLVEDFEVLGITSKTGGNRDGSRGLQARKGSAIARASRVDRLQR